MMDSLGVRGNDIKHMVSKVEPSKKGFFVIVDGIDGSGKGTILDTWKKQLLQQKRRVFDLREHWRKYKTFPCFNDIKKADVIISCEPTLAWVGRAIREEIVRSSDYSGVATAHAFSLDREILYRRFLIPALRAGKVVLQERGVTTSLVYQTIQKNGLTRNQLMNLPGNRLALIWAPHVLVVASVSPPIALQRLVKRSHKKDSSIFENLSFEQRARKQFLSRAFQQVFTKRGTIVKILSTEGAIEDTQKRANQLLRNLLGI